ncbi:nucleotidyltransferase family protein [Sulfurimonas sp. SAG-AH-194-C21]|nr:nucleotidyltransferase family protein [Sulfurimonas sp. SAG-AH-194-C21]MDF1884315.1 nucleotidyltransferase family protein [Sulfurimonas sp. SAG-AH-194-C21]
MNTKQEILEFLSSNQIYIKEHYSLTKLGLFGSFARDEQTKDSDVDLLIEIKSNTANINDLKNSLSNYLTQAFGRNVDLAREKYLKSYAKKEILQDTIYVY